MEFLHIEDYDPVRMRCCCPFHEEKTPSFIYNPKANNCHCFGCGKDADIYDSLVLGEHMTFAEAAEKVFDLAGITYSFGEHGVKTRHQYRYPHPEQNEHKEQVYKYLQSRKISPATADYLDIRQDDEGNCVFNYYDTNDTLCMVKYRPSRKVKKGENKNWCQPGADTAPLLFNMNRVNTTQPLVITTGELDTASLIECGIQNAVSCPLGDANLHWLEENFDWLEQFNSIIVCHDNDESGMKFVKEATARLGSWRCKVANCPEYLYNEEKKTKRHIKDINETLYWFGKEAIIDMIANAADTPIPSVVDFSDVEEKDLSSIDGVETGFHSIDKEIMRLFYGTFNIISGLPGSGKTSWLYSLVCSVMDRGERAWLFSRELPDFMSKNWLNMILAGPRNVKEYHSSNDAVYYKIKPEAKKAISESYREQLFLYRDDYSNSVEDLQNSMVDSARKYGCKLFIIDNLMTVDLHADDENKYEKQTEFVNWLIHFSAKYDVCTILVCHPRKLQFGQREMEMGDVAGSSNLINLAHRAFSLRRVTKQEQEGTMNRKGDAWAVPPCPYSVIIKVLKDRMRGRAGMEFGLYYDTASRRFFGNPAEYDRQYSWDTNTYSAPLPYPIGDEEEVFGQHCG